MLNVSVTFIGDNLENRFDFCFDLLVVLGDSSLDALEKHLVKLFNFLEKFLLKFIDVNHKGSKQKSVFKEERLDLLLRLNVFLQ